MKEPVGISGFLYNYQLLNRYYPMIRLFLVEDHYAWIVGGFRNNFRPKRDRIQVAGHAATPDEAIQSADPESFDILILDLHIPGTEPVDNIRSLQKKFPDKPIVIFTNETASIWKIAMLREGASGYIIKDAEREEVKMALQKIIRGEKYFSQSPEVALQAIQESQKIVSAESISPLQQDILIMLSKGHSHKDIALQTAMSRSSIEKVLTKLRALFNATNNLELVSICKDNHLI